jgi:uncharacterized damage-inducible protein DinB
MGQRSDDLAARFEAANNALIDTVQQCSDDQWKKTCSGEGWSVGVTAHHVASSHGPVAGLAQGIANGQQLPAITMEMIDAGNAQHAQEHANCTKEETIDLLRRDGQAAAEMVRGLSDEQLDRSQALPLLGGPQMSAQQIIEMILIGHPTEHTAHIKEAAGL